MPRRNRPRRGGRPAGPRDEPPDEPARPAFPSTTAPIPAPDGWTAQRYSGGTPGRSYVCPRCGRTVERQSDHVVAWQTDEPSDDRPVHRHWHTHCWTVAVREGLNRYRWL